MAGYERAFFKEVEKLLSDITNPEYRQLVVEVMLLFIAIYISIYIYSYVYSYYDCLLVSKQCSWNY